MYIIRLKLKKNTVSFKHNNLIYLERLMFRIDISFSGDGVLLISPGNLLQKVLSEHMT